MAWRPLVPADDVASGTVHEASFDGLDLVVWRSASGAAVVMEARCPHQWSHLGAEGVVDGEELVCTAHFWRFAVDGTGTKVTIKGRRDDKADVVAFPCREHDGWIEVDPGPETVS